MPSCFALALPFALGLVGLGLAFLGVGLPAARCLGWSTTSPGDIRLGGTSFALRFGGGGGLLLPLGTLGRIDLQRGRLDFCYTV